MSQKIQTSAPGKLLLMGEHAVVYGKPCIVTAVDHRMEAIVETVPEMKLFLEAEDVKLTGYQKPLTELGQKEVPKDAKFVEFTLKNMKQKYGLKTGLKITTKAGFSSTFGFGSSSAVTVCTAKAVSELLGLNLSNKELFEICYQTVLDVQGKGSGFDVAVAIWGGTILFQNKGEVVENLDIPGFDLVAGYTGKKYGTVQVLDEVLALEKEFPEIIKGSYDNIGYLVNQAVKFIKSADSQGNLANSQKLLVKLGHLMNFDQGQLETIGVGCLELAQIIFSARNAGAFGAKLSGAGKGDCAVALVDKTNKTAVQKGIKKAGFEVIGIKVGAEGVKVV